MKKITFLLLSLLSLSLSSCGPKYDEDKCDELIEKYNDKGNLGDKDIKLALEQYEATIDFAESQLELIEKKAKKKDDEAIDLYEELTESTEWDHMKALDEMLENSDPKGDDKKKFSDLQHRGDKIEKLENKVIDRLKRIGWEEPY